MIPLVFPSPSTLFTSSWHSSFILFTLQLPTLCNSLPTCHPLHLLCAPLGISLENSGNLVFFILYLLDLMLDFLKRWQLKYLKNETVDNSVFHGGRTANNFTATTLQYYMVPLILFGDASVFVVIIITFLWNFYFPTYKTSVFHYLIVQYFPLPPLFGSPAFPPSSLPWSRSAWPGPSSSLGSYAVSPHRYTRAWCLLVLDHLLPAKNSLD